MSSYLYWLLSFPLRADIDPAILRVLGAVAANTAPKPADLAVIHPVPRYFLANWRDMLADEAEPLVGTPIRISHTHAGRPCISIEFCQHDDTFANGGWIFWLWVMTLVARPERPNERLVIGCHGLYRNASETTLVTVTATGIDEGDRAISFDEIEEALADAPPEEWEDY